MRRYANPIVLLWGAGGGACLILILCCIFLYLSYFLKSYTLFLLSILTGIIYSIIIYQSIKLKNTLKKISNKCITMFVLGQEIIWHKKNFELSFLCFESYIHYVWRNGEKTNIVSYPNKNIKTDFNEKDLIELYNQSIKCNVLDKYYELPDNYTLFQLCNYYYIHKIIYEFIINKSEISFIIICYTPIIFIIGIILSSIISK